MRLSWLLLACLAGCQTTGAVELTLDLPSAAGLTPTGMTTVTLIATGSDGVPSATTSVIDGNQHFAAGDLPVGDGVQLDVLLRDVSNRLVGVGEAPALVDIAGDRTTSLAIPVRRPFVYAATPAQLVAFDPSLDARDPMFQSTVAGIDAPMFAISVGGDRLAVVTSNAVQAVDTATNELVGAPIALPGAARDATSVPGSRLIAVAYDSGLAFVDIDAGTVTTAPADAPVDRVTVGLAADGTRVAYGLVRRVAPPYGPVDACSGTSAIVTANIDAPAALTSVSAGDGLSDIAADPTTARLFATAPCSGQVEALDGPRPTMVAALERAAVLSVLGGRVWAAGSHASAPSCLDRRNDPTPCVETSDESCPSPAGPVDNYVIYVTDGASLIVESIPTAASGDAVVFDVPARRETIINTNDDARQHAQVLKAINTEPLDLVALPGGQYVSLVTRSTYFIQQLINAQGVVLPCLKANTGDWLLMDMASVSIAGRVRTQCDLKMGTSDEDFRDWECDAPPEQELSRFGEYQPTSVGALFGAR